MDTIINLKKNLINAFGENNDTIRLFRAPARINVIGEHVDYLGGFVLPAAIDFQVCVAIRKNDQGKINLYSEQYKESVSKDTPSYDKKYLWANYVYGVVDELKKEGFTITGFDMAIDGNIPQGAGLSSSAALEVVTGYALSSIFHLSISREKIALIGQAAENNFVGMKCGIMDQYIIANGKKDHCILLNTDTLSKTYHTLNLNGHEFYLINSNVKHSLQDSDYNNRRKECESALKKVQSLEPDIKNLYDLPLDTVLNKFNFSEKEEKRVKHVLGEKDRTNKLLDSFAQGKIKNAGECLYGTHESLSKLFEVSCDETDFLVQALQKENVIGARMIGGGFGGSILVLDKIGNREKVEAKVKKDYFEKFNLNATFYGFQISDGVSELQ
ncbi:MAG TPA: galactokinase [Leptospiraceae bacterium]|nr:galactokinase [Leptospiraceae bacterium]HMW04548.1 galactokinase [Leptospiraceae bacterium]HMX33457.1 galactokinase [Leptospiraceae bacterium]HMY30734.1 galactokinase [Leptospiraceae bacterium]HMZ64312.1 galactokinase [Leptospiraceae bacterium]